MVPEYPELYQMAGVRGSWQMGWAGNCCGIQTLMLYFY